MYKRVDRLESNVQICLMSPSLIACVSSTSARKSECVRLLKRQCRERSSIKSTHNIIRAFFCDCIESSVCVCLCGIMVEHSSAVATDGVRVLMLRISYITYMQPVGSYTVYTNTRRVYDVYVSVQHLYFCRLPDVVLNRRCRTLARWLPACLPFVLL